MSSEQSCLGGQVEQLKVIREKKTGILSFSKIQVAIAINFSATGTAEKPSKVLGASYKNLMIIAKTLEG